ncbi:MAG: tRNA (adenosine(37)-N6)-threonylcarbamoyltransferase complex transferase subunit TsaD [Spirochaetes bacterium]|nr:tRNA (adenosine(37)-N6)-threonylcarbamoyltransferase complex transferase subunit TsaD [Spirochaetota bacterium]
MALGLGLESSCDETAAAVVRDGRVVLSNIISSQIDLHRDYYGVVPEIASRAHLETINILIEKALEESGASFKDLDYVAATNRPGLVGSLLIALLSAKVISRTMGIPLVAVNHLEAHLYAPFLEGREQAFPYIGLLVSGGNTVLYHVRGVGDMEIIGRTADDAAGEAFDKIAKYLDLGYPGGPVIEKLARTAAGKTVRFPKILPEPGDTRFSYSGIKTAVINYVKQNPGADRAGLVHGFQERVLELLVRRAFAAARSRGISSIVVAGGVAANGRLREMLDGEKRGSEEIIIPSPGLCTDNAAMVAGIGFRYFDAGRYDSCAVDVHGRV